MVCLIQFSFTSLPLFDLVPVTILSRVNQIKKLLHYRTKNSIFTVTWNAYTVFQDDKWYSFSDFFLRLHKPPFFFSKAFSPWGNWKKHCWRLWRKTFIIHFHIWIFKSEMSLPTLIGLWQYTVHDMYFHIPYTRWNRWWCSKNTLLDTILHGFTLDIFWVSGSSGAEHHTYLPELKTLFCMYICFDFLIYAKNKCLLSLLLPANHKQVKSHFVVVTFNLILILFAKLFFIIFMRNN